MYNFINITWVHIWGIYTTYHTLFRIILDQFDPFQENNLLLNASFLLSPQDYPNITTDRGVYVTFNRCSITENRARQGTKNFVRELKTFLARTCLSSLVTKSTMTAGKWGPRKGLETKTMYGAACYKGILLFEATKIYL